MAVLDVRNPRALEIVDADVEWEPLAGGFRFTEGPVWVEEDDALYFTDIPADTIYRWAADSYEVSIFRRSSRKANGMTRDPGGFLLVCEHGGRRVARLARDGGYEVLAERFAGRRFNSPNDIVVDRLGRIWFTDPTYGIDGLEVGYPAEQEQPLCGVYRVDPGGTTELVADDLVTPNGLAFSPDQRMLYVADTVKSSLRRFEVDTEGRLRDTGPFAVLNRSSGRGLPDGLRVSREGYIFLAGPGGVFIIDTAGGILGHLRAPEQVANVEIGSRGGSRFLAITASTSVYRIPLRG
ncbi:MAG: SMP-30/gluconolactonase/LRE family protein [Clostridia bacterium]